MQSIIRVFVILLASICFSSCYKDRAACFDGKLYRDHKDVACTLDCGGVTGCDGNFYCNECEANRNGIEIE